MGTDLRVDTPYTRIRTNITNLAASTVYAKQQCVPVEIVPMKAFRTDFTNSSIPKLVHMTVKDKNSLTPRQQTVMDQWKSLNPQHVVTMYDDTDMHDFVKVEYPEFLTLYESVYEPVERADIWRCLIVHARGGVYSDTDWMPEIPVDEWAQRIWPGDDGVRVLFGYELQAIQVRKIIPILQWGFMGVKGHQSFYKIVERIREGFVEELLTGSFLGDAIKRTGPGPFAEGLLRYLQQNGADLSTMDNNKSYRHGDVGIASVEFFEHNGSLARHMFTGSWKDQNGDWSKRSQESFLAFQVLYWNGTVRPL